jgi:hypothetical protein
VDLEKLEVSDYVIGGSALVFLIAMFLPWEGIDFAGFGSASNSGWDYFLSGILVLLVALAMVAQVVIDKVVDGVDLPEAPWGIILLAAGGFCAVVVILRVIIPANEGNSFASVDLDRKYGVFIAAIAAIGLAVGGFLKFQAQQSTGGGTGGTTSSGGSGTPTQF